MNLENKKKELEIDSKGLRDQRYGMKTNEDRNDEEKNG